MYACEYAHVCMQLCMYICMYSHFLISCNPDDTVVKDSKFNQLFGIKYDFILVLKNKTSLMKINRLASISF